MGKQSFEVDVQVYPFVRVDDSIVYLNRYDGFKLVEQSDMGEWYSTDIEGVRDGQYKAIGIRYSCWDNYTQETALEKAQLALDTIQTALEEWNGT